MNWSKKTRKLTAIILIAFFMTFAVEQQRAEANPAVIPAVAVAAIATACVACGIYFTSEDGVNAGAQGLWDRIEEKEKMVFLAGSIYILGPELTSKIFAFKNAIMGDEITTIDVINPTTIGSGTMIADNAWHTFGSSGVYDINTTFRANTSSTTANVNFQFATNLNILYLTYTVSGNNVLAKCQLGGAGTVYTRTIECETSAAATALVRTGSAWKLAMTTAGVVNVYNEDYLLATYTGYTNGWLGNYKCGTTTVGSFDAGYTQVKSVPIAGNITIDESITADKVQDRQITPYATPSDLVGKTAETIDDHTSIDPPSDVTDETGTTVGWLSNIWSRIGALPASITSSLVGTGTADTVDFDPLKNLGITFTNKFPFSLPWDIKNGFSKLVSTAWNPVWNIDLTDHVPGFLMTLDLAMWNPILACVRVVEILLFDIALVMATGKLIGGDQ